MALINLNSSNSVSLRLVSEAKKEAFARKRRLRES
jgi:hypothetical protein